MVHQSFETNTLCGLTCDVEITKFVIFSYVNPQSVFVSKDSNGKHWAWVKFSSHQEAVQVVNALDKYSIDNQYIINATLV